MKRMIWKKVIALIAVFTLVSSTYVTAQAANSNEVEKIVDGSELTEEEFSETIVTNPVRGNLLNQGMARLTNNGNGSVNVYGAVFGSIVCDKLILEMTLQRYANGYWVNVQSFSDTAYNNSLLTKSYNVKVTKGYYYRMKAACVAIKGGVSESQDPVTNGIWIG